MENDEIKKAERLLQKTAQQRREAHASSTDGAMQGLESLRNELIRDYNRTLDSIQTVIKTVDREGSFHSSVIRGISGAAPGAGEDTIVRSNMRSRKRRAAKIKEVLAELDRAIQDVKEAGRQGTRPVENARKRLIELRASIPDENEMELISGPKGSLKKKLLDRTEP